MRRAFTAVELTIVIGVLAILSAIAMPAVSGLLDRIRVRAAVTEVESLFGAARHIAIARGAQSTVQIDAAAGIISVTANDTVVRSGLVGPEFDVKLTSNRTSMSYSATGIGYGAANLSLVVGKGSAADTIVVSRLGRVRH